MNGRMTIAEMDAIAKDIDAVTLELAKVEILKTASPQGCAMALAVAAATYVVHTGGSEQDFKTLVSAAWQHTVRLHR